MSKITDKPYREACANGDGTYSMKKAAQWLFEATTGKTMPDEEADALIAQAQQRAAERRRAK